MNNTYLDLIQQTFDFPQEGFEVKDNNLEFYGVPLMDIIEQYDTPLKITYLPKIGEQLKKARGWFDNAIKKHNYKGSYTYCYCTKSSHFSFVIKEVLKNGGHIETSSAFDMPIIHSLVKSGEMSKSHYIICNGFKRPLYTENIAGLINSGFENVIPVLDNMNELEEYKRLIDGKCKLGIRIASEEEPTFDFYTSRLGIRYIDIIDFYKQQIKPLEKFELKMLHFFINTGIRDNIYYWSELNKCLNTYYRLKKICPSLDSLNIGGGLPIKNSLGFEFDYEYMIDEIVNQIKTFCDQKNIPVPNLFTEFGSFTVGESAANIYSVIGEKAQNDKETWYMIDNSFITTLPDTWGINQRFILLAVNNWNNNYRRVNIGGLTCDSLDYYNSEAHANQVFLPELNEGQKQYIGFFHTGAYQESLSGYGGIKHCLIPSPKHILVDKDKDGNFNTEVFAEEQTSDSMLKILGY